MITTTEKEKPRHYRMSGSAAVHIGASPRVVWDLLTDVTRMGEWSPETRRAEWLGGATGPAVGVRFRGHNRRGLFQRWSTRPKIKVCEPEREFTFVLGFRDMDFVTWRYVLEPAPGGTLVTESFSVWGYALYGLLRPRRRERQLVDGVQQTLTRLKAAAEK